MPKIDPITGCEVMSLLEFCEQEGERKGQTADEYMSDIFEDMAKEANKEAERWLEPEMREEVLQELRNAVALELREWKSCYWSDIEDNNPNGMDDWPKPPIPIKIIDMEDSQSSYGMRTNNSMLKGLCKCKDGKVRRFTYKYWTYSGDFYEPPSEDWELNWEEMKEAN
ncbi:MAG: hypothetical protein ACOCUT_00225 [bacterium]